METPLHEHDCPAGCVFKGRAELDGKPVDLYEHPRENGSVTLIVREGDEGDYNSFTVKPGDDLATRMGGHTVHDFLNYLER